MNHILKIGQRYYYNRRVPEDYREYDSRSLIRISLKTDSKQEAIRRAIVQDREIERYWQQLILSGQKHSHDSYKRAVQQARTVGFAYLKSDQLAQAPLAHIIERADYVAEAKFSPLKTEAALGGIAPPELMVSDLIVKFWSFTKNRIMNKSPNQIRKYKAPRIKTVKNFIKVAGDIVVTNISRDDILQFRDWWVSRIEHEKMSAATANKDLIHLKNIIETVNENMGLGLDTPHLFRKITLQDRFTQARVPFETAFIRDELLNHEKLAGLNDQAKWFLFAMAETGARISELTGLRPQDIVLDAEVPHISIVDRPDKPLKTPHSQRKIPLVGFALDAFKACPDGFPNYHDRPDSLSGLLNKYLRDHQLLPSDNHSVYSLRHSFQDRILSVNAPDRIQAELMGHKFQRPMYGDGATLAHKLEWVKKVRVK
jgi:integrase